MPQFGFTEADVCAPDAAQWTDTVIARRGAEAQTSSLLISLGGGEFQGLGARMRREEALPRTPTELEGTALREGGSFQTVSCCNTCTVLVESLGSIRRARSRKAPPQ